MTKLIVLLAVLTVLAYAMTATATWITRKKAPLAIVRGRAPQHPTAAERDKALRWAQLPAMAAIVFSVVMFATMFRVSIGLAGQASLPIALTTGLSASGGLLLFSAFPAAKAARAVDTSTPEKDAQEAQPLRPIVVKKSLALPLTTMLALIAFFVVVALDGFPSHTTAELLDPVPLTLVTGVFSGSALLALRRLATRTCLPDPRMAVLDRRWREFSTRLLLRFTSGALLASFGGTALYVGLAMATATTSGPFWGIACAAVGAVLVLTGVALVALAAKGGFTLRGTVLDGTPAPRSA